jgi:hypothetical protein
MFIEGTPFRGSLNKFNNKNQIRDEHRKRVLTPSIAGDLSTDK